MPPLFHFILARADGTDATESNMRLLLLLGGSVAAICILVRVVMLLAVRNARPDAPMIDAAGIVWGLIAAGSAIFAIVRQWTWEKQHLQDILSGYVDPGEPAPGYPWALWIALALAFIALFSWASWKQRSAAPDEQ